MTSRTDGRALDTSLWGLSLRSLAFVALIAGPVGWVLGCSGSPSDPHPTVHLGSPHPLESLARIDIAFCLDATGSMQGLIDEAKARIREIDAELRNLNPQPSVRFGIVTYRDVGEEYITTLYGLDPDVGRVAEALGSIKASGGGDDPEHVVAGLRRAVDDLRWDPEASVRFLFLVGDAEPHLDYGEESNVHPNTRPSQRERDHDRIVSLWRGNERRWTRLLASSGR